MTTIHSIPIDVLLNIFSDLPLENHADLYKVNQEFRRVIEQEPVEELEPVEEEEPLNRVGRTLRNLWNEKIRIDIRADNTTWKKHFRGVDIGRSALPRTLLRRLCQLDRDPADPDRPYICQTHMLVDIPESFTSSGEGEGPFSQAYTIKTFDDALLDRNRPTPFKDLAGNDIPGSERPLLLLQNPANKDAYICFTKPDGTENIHMLRTLAPRYFQQLVSDGFTQFQLGVGTHLEATLEIPLTAENFEKLIIPRFGSERSSSVSRCHSHIRERPIKKRVWALLKVDKPLSPPHGVNTPDEKRAWVKAYGKQEGVEMDLPNTLVAKTCLAMHLLQKGHYPQSNCVMLCKDVFAQPNLYGTLKFDEERRLVVTASYRNPPKLIQSHWGEGFNAGVYPVELFFQDEPDAWEELEGEDLASLFHEEE